jgi:hypothetical protein
VGDDKNADAVDSWYLYHPLMNLARLALNGDERARDLFLRSIDFGIKAASILNTAGRCNTTSPISTSSPPRPMTIGGRPMSAGFMRGSCFRPLN